MVARRAPTAAVAVHIRWFSDAKGNGASADAAACSSSGAQASASVGAATSPKLERIIDQLEKQVNNLKDRVVRSLVVEENASRLIAKRDVNNARAYAVTAFAKSLVDVADDFERALTAVPANTMTLHDAARAGKLARVRALLDAGADVDANDRFGHTPLQYAVAVEQYLFERGANTEASGEGSLAPLIATASDRHLALVRLLVERGANKDTKNRHGTTPLMEVCLLGHVAVAEYLLEQGCDRDHADYEGWTALHCAAAWGRLEIAQLLMRWGANLNARTTHGKLPINLATDYGHPAVADAIRAEEIRAEEIRRRYHGFKRDRSTIPGTE